MNLRKRMKNGRRKNKFLVLRRKTAKKKTLFIGALKIRGLFDFSYALK